MAGRLLVPALLLSLLHLTRADVPVHCRHDQIVGDWTFHVGSSATSSLSQIQCAALPASKQDQFSSGPEFGFAGEPNFKVGQTLKVVLSSPNLAKSAGLADGTWTMVYDQGFRVDIGGKTFFAISRYEVSSAMDSVEDSKVLARYSHCHKTFPGWYTPGSMDKLPSDCAVGCWWGEKSKSEVNVQTISADSNPDLRYQPEHEMVAAINADPSSSWKATTYAMFEGKTMRELQMMGGFTYRPPTQKIHEFPQGLIESADEQRPTQVSEHPKQWDWRNVQGVNHVNEPINQGACGSCYAVSSADALSSRIHIKTGKKIVVSAQQILCQDRYTQGCKGGFPMTVWLFGWNARLADQTLVPYHGSDGAQSCTAAKVAQGGIGAIRGEYVGGFYGGCSVEGMMREIHEHGPVVVAFEATPDLYHYKSGIYKGAPSGQSRKTRNRFEPTNHAVVVVGWGEDDVDGPYWIVKNSWGKQWGEQGYFRIRRGNDENGIESMASAAVPVEVGASDNLAGCKGVGKLVESDVDVWEEIQMD